MLPRVDRIPILSELYVCREFIDRVGTLSARFTADKRIPILSELYVCREFIDRVGTLSARLLLIKESVTKAEETGLLGIAVYD